LRDWTEREFDARRGAFESRRRAGFVRECHGDLHLGNIARIGGKITIFDCIEFNDHLRWIDVLSEVAFTTMDLEDRGRRDLAHRFLDRYLALTGDYEGLAVYRFYAVYRALVRAKVACLRMVQLADGAQRTPLLREFRGYLALARRLAHPAPPALVVTHGLSGAGKTAVTQHLLEDIGAIRIRTDVERKRAHGPATPSPGGAPRASVLYAPDVTRATYAHACDLARRAMEGGFRAIIDGTFLKRWQRDAARALAAELGMPFVIVSFRAEDATLRRRIAGRAAAATDASEANEAVLDHQQAMQEPLGPDEAPFVVTYDAQAPLEHSRDPQAWQGVLARLGNPERTG